MHQKQRHIRPAHLLSTDAIHALIHKKPTQAAEGAGAAVGAAEANRAGKDILFPHKRETTKVFSYILNGPFLPSIYASL